MGSARAFLKLSLFAWILTIYDSYASTSITLALLAIHCNLYVTDEVDTFVKSGVHKNLGIL